MTVLENGVTRGFGPPLQMMSFEVTSVMGPSYWENEELLVNDRVERWGGPTVG